MLCGMKRSIDDIEYDFASGYGCENRGGGGNAPGDIDENGSDTNNYTWNDISTTELFSSQNSLQTNYVATSPMSSPVKKDSHTNSNKRTQKQKVTTEAHQKTVALMMNASKELYNSNSADISELSTTDSQDSQEETSDNASYYQKPYW